MPEFRRQAGPQRPPEPPPISSEDAKRIIEGDAELLVRKARDLSGNLRGEQLSSQLRRLYGEVKRIEMSWSATNDQAYRRLVLLKPRLAYQVSRERRLRPVQQALEPLIDLVKGDRTRFQHFVEFFEAIVAYAKN